MKLTNFGTSVFFKGKSSVVSKVTKLGAEQSALRIL